MCGDKGCDAYTGKDDKEDCTKKGFKICDDITASLFYVGDTSGERMKMKPLDKDLDYSTLPNLGTVSFN